MFLPIESKSNVCVTAVLLIYFHYRKKYCYIRCPRQIDSWNAISRVPLVFLFVLILWYDSPTAHMKKMHYFILVDVVGATRNISDRGLCQP